MTFESLDQIKLVLIVCKSSFPMINFSIFASSHKLVIKKITTCNHIFMTLYELTIIIFQIHYFHGIRISAYNNIISIQKF